MSYQIYSDLGEATKKRTMSQKFRYILGWVFIRPIRWAFSNMIRAASPRWIPEKCEWDNSIDWPNIHWFFLYKTVYKFFSWLNWDAWRYFCDWGTHRETFPLVARVIKKISETTAGGAQYGGYQCYHCASSKGCQIDLANDETGKTFKLLETWTSSSECGTDYRFRGVTTCPQCGYTDEYEDGSL